MLIGRRRWTVFAAFFVALLACREGWSEDFHVIAYDVDPPIEIDGRFGDWEKIPNVITLDTREHMTYGADMWSGPKDLSAVIRLAWRTGWIAIGAEVTDDRVLQPYAGRDIWKGDHFNFWVDMTPGVAPERTMFGKGQCHVVVSPGSLDATAGGDGALPPEIYVYRPEGLKQQGGEVAARRTETGYVVEAFIPFSRLGVRGPAMGQDANFEVAISDADLDPAKQETFMTYGTEVWVYSRQRMLPMAFGDGNGRAAPPVRGASLFEHHELPPGETLKITFNASSIPENKAPFLFFRARTGSKRVAGYRTGMLSAELNGERVGRDRLSNRPAQSTMMDGRSIGVVSGDDLLTLPYTPTFEAVDRHSGYGLIDNVKACEFEFNVAEVLVEGENTLVFQNHTTSQSGTVYTAVLGKGELRIKAKVPPPPPPKPAPIGEIPTIEPRRVFPKTYAITGREGTRLHLRVSGSGLSVDSRFSTPDGQWRTASNTFFEHARKVIEHDEWIEVHDTFRNLTDSDLPIIQEHACALGERFKAAWLGGLKMPAGNGDRQEPQNPSVFAITADAGIGLVPLNDEFHAHVNQVARDGTIILRDRSFYLAPGGTYTAEWAIVPVTEPNVWAFVNAARRLRDVNYTLKYCSAFMYHRWPIYEWPDTTFRSFVENKGVNFVVKGNEAVRNKNGHYARCTDWMAGPHDDYVNLFKRVREFFPPDKVKTGIYMDPFLDTTEENNVRFKADRGLDSAGNHINYGGSHAYLKLFVPALQEGRWGRELAKMFDVILRDVGADGIYMDEPSYSRARYVYSHLDGCSADIDPKTFKLVRKKGCVPLLSLDWRRKHFKRVLDEGRPFVANGAPHTRTMARLKYQAFCETGSISNCYRMVLHSPVALGDHLTERKYEDSYRVMMQALDRGCLYAWYTHIFHTHKAPTAYMYPFTPIELHSGYVIGEERILTNRSGYFGWGDASDFEAHVFDRHGRPTTEINVPRVQRRGKAYAEVRLPEGCMAILVRVARQTD